MRILPGVLLLATSALGCKVYDESLLLRRDSAVADASDLGSPADHVDASLDLVAADAPAPDAADAPAPDVAPMDAQADAPDVAPITDVADVVVDAADVVDAAVPDVPPSCDAVLRTGSACIEPVSGHAWRADDPRMIAPRAITFANNRALVSDVGSGRVLSFDLAGGARTTVTLGNGVLGATPPAGGAPTDPMGAITAMVALPDGALALADESTRQVLRATATRVDALPMLSFQSAPTGVAWDEGARTLYVSADNRIHRVTLEADGGVGAAEAVVGLGCGLGCSDRFNSDGLSGVATAVNNPAGLDVDAEYVYFADRDNCRVRRFRRADPDRVVSTFAGTRCDEVNDPFAGLGAFAVPAQLRLGRVTDVKVGADGSVYFLDASRCAVFGVTPPRMPGGDAIPRVVAGSAQGCGRVANAGPPLGPLGGLGVSGDRSAVYFVDLREQRVGRILGTSNGGSPSIDFPIAPGAIPSATEAMSTARLGAPAALTRTDDGATLYVAAHSTGRAYEIVGGAVRSLTGDAAAPLGQLATNFPVGSLPLTRIEGFTRASGRTLLSLTESGVVAELREGALHRLAGTFPAPLFVAAADGGVDGGSGDADASDAAATDGALLASELQLNGPSHALATPTGFVFGDAQGRVWRVGANGALSHLAGAGSLTSGMIPPSAGTGVAATLAAIGSVRGLAIDGAGRTFVADGTRNVIWSVGLETPPRARIVAGVIDRRAPLTDAPTFGPEAVLASPGALVFDGASTVYIADTDANRVRALNVLSGQVTTVAGSGSTVAASSGGDYGPARMATLSRPAGLAFFAGRLYVAEQGSGRIRVIRLP